MQVDVTEHLAHVLATSEQEGRGDDFYGRLCEAITQMTSMRRAVLFRYDRTRRQVRAAGGYGLDLNLFAGGFFTVDIAPIARRALIEDNVVEAADHLERELPPQYVRELGVTQVVCAPMVARGLWVGVILADREGLGPPLTDAERETLWVLGKTAALAAMARVATRQHERALQLEQRIEMAQDIHDGVIQRLFGLSLALSGEQPLDTDTRARCAAELHTALADLRHAVTRPPGRSPAPTTTTLYAEIERLQHGERRLRLTCATTQVSVPARVEPLAQAVLVEAVRNAQRHAQPTNVAITTETTANRFVMDISNDGVGEQRTATAGMGLRVAAFAALQAGGTLEYGPTDDALWRVRLTVPAQPE